MKTKPKSKARPRNKTVVYLLDLIREFNKDVKDLRETIKVLNEDAEELRKDIRDLEKDKNDRISFVQSLYSKTESKLELPHGNILFASARLMSVNINTAPAKALGDALEQYKQAGVKCPGILMSKVTCGRLFGDAVSRTFKFNDVPLACTEGIEDGVVIFLSLSYSP